MLNDVVSGMLDPKHPYCGRWVQTNPHLGSAKPGTFPEEFPVALHMCNDSLSQSMMVPTECSTRPTHAFVKDLNLIAVNGREYPSACTRWHSADRGIACGLTTQFPFFLNDTAFIHQAIDPILRCAPRNPCTFLNIRHSKRALIQRKASHQVQIVPPPFNDTVHNDHG
jgi:hypothetical protein